MTKDLHQGTLEFLIQKHNEQNFARDDLRVQIERLKLSKCSDEELFLLKDYFHSAIASRRSGNTRIASLEYVQEYVLKIEQQQNQNFTRSLVQQLSRLNGAVDNFNTSVAKHAVSSSQQSKTQFWVNLLITAMVAFTASAFGAWFGVKLSTNASIVDKSIFTKNEIQKTPIDSKMTVKDK